MYMKNHARPNPWKKLVLVHECSNGIGLEALSFRVPNRPNLTILVKKAQCHSHYLHIPWVTPNIITLYKHSAPTIQAATNCCKIPSHSILQCKKVKLMIPKSCASTYLHRDKVYCLRSVPEDHCDHLFHESKFLNEGYSFEYSS